MTTRHPAYLLKFIHTRHQSRLFWAAVGLLCVGCSGQISRDNQSGSDPNGIGGAGGGDDLPPSPLGDDPLSPLAPVAGPSFVCDANAVPATPPARRLTRLQYENTLRDLLGIALGSKDDASKVLAAVATPMATMPDDVAHYVGAKSEGFAFKRMDQVLSDNHVSAGYETAVALGAALSQPTYLGKLLGGCATDGNASNDAKCLSDFVSRFGSRALRTPLSSDDLAFYIRLAREGGGPIAPVNVANVIAGLLSSPRFLYRIESGDKAVPDSADRLFSLTAHELAARLSYQFWDSLPDDSLWQAATDGSLFTPETFRAQLTRIMGDPRAQSSITQFFGQWLQLDQIPKLDQFKDSARFKAFTGGKLPSAELNAAMAQEIVDMASYFSTKGSGSVNDLLQTNASFARSPELAALYGVPVWNGTGEPPTFPSGERPGLLTRGAVLASASGQNRPIMRGVFVRGRILCDELPDPPAGALDNLPAPPVGVSKRQEVEQISEQRDPCAGCHKNFINPIGFTLESFDALGRKRTNDIVYDDGGKVTGTYPINDTAIPRVDFDDETEAHGPGDLADLIVNSGKVPGCLARQYFRFSTGRREDLERDGCTLERIRRAFAGDEGLSGGLRSIALDPTFWRRSF